MNGFGSMKSTLLGKDKVHWLILIRRVLTYIFSSYYTSAFVSKNILDPRCRTPMVVWVHFR